MTGQVDLRDYYERKAGKRREHYGANVHFERRSVPDLIATEKAGRVVEVEKDFIVIHYPGRAPEPVEVTESHKAEYPEQWKAFVENLEPPTSGFPLDQWALMARDIVNELRTIGFKTVENIAEAPDDVCRKHRIVEQWRKKAREFLKNAGAGANEVTRLVGLVEKLERRCKKLEESNVLLMKRIEAETGATLIEAKDEHPSH